MVIYALPLRGETQRRRPGRNEGAEHGSREACHTSGAPRQLKDLFTKFMPLKRAHSKDWLPMAISNAAQVHLLPQAEAAPLERPNFKLFFNKLPEDFRDSLDQRQREAMARALIPDRSPPLDRSEGQHANTWLWHLCRPDGGPGAT